MNNYSDLTRLKSLLNISVTTYDTDLLIFLGVASRAIDKFCNRVFYVKPTTYYYDGSSSPLFIEDLISISGGSDGIFLDEDGDATYEETMASTDYILYPLNKLPKIMVKISSDSDYGGFANGIKKGVKIIATWGYAESTTPYIDSTTTIAEELDATETGVDVALGTSLAAGQTILVESEQMYLLSISSNTLTVQRGVNGTTGATHATGKTIYIYQYPESIFTACLIQAMRWWKRKDSAFSDVLGTTELGQFIMYKGLDPDVKILLAPFVKRCL